MKMPRLRTGYVQVYISDILDEICDDDLLAEVEDRKLGDYCDLDIVREAYELLQRNAIAEARGILERLISPKWGSPDKCAEQYEQLKLSK
jgi:hypothetical protein